MSAARLLELGIDIDPNGATEQRVPCPQCNRGPRDDALGVNIATGVFHCFRCGWSRKANVAPRDISGPQPSTEKHTTLSEWGRSLWTQCQPIGGVAREYLLARRCVIPPEDGDLRWHLSLKHPSGYVGPALVALVTDALTCEPLTLHRTWIKADGNKADVAKPRLLLAGHRKAGGVIWLLPNEAVTHGLAVAEGIESALSAAQVFWPIWATVDAGNMATMPVLDGIEALTIYADNDAAGIRAAHTLAQRWADAGREANITMPTEPGADINDVVAA